MTKRVLAAFLFGLACVVATAAHGQATDYPSKPIRLLAGGTSGTRNDQIGRFLASQMESRLGQPVTVELIPGIRSVVAAELAARAPADGHTLLVAPIGALVISPVIDPKLPYDPVRSFAPISLVAEYPLLLVVGAGHPATSVRELLDYGRQNAETATYGSVSASAQLTAELMNDRTGVKFKPASFDEPDDLVQALEAGKVSMAFVETAIVQAALKAGKIRALAITTARRTLDFPDTPTLGESGVADMVINLWTGLVAPAGTPPAIITVLQDLVYEILDSSRGKSAMDQILVDAWPTTSKEFTDVIAKDLVRWRAIAGKSSVKLD
jgi:tripartite-type tricarboxylate transporter receptor subunit TctC